MKYPIGIQTFEQIRKGGYVYVDKTALIYNLVTLGKIYFLSRPRRFGKSLLISTLKAYFQGRKDLFEGLAIDSLETEWNEFPVFHLDFNGKDFSKAFELDKTIERFVENAEEEYGKDKFAQTIGDRFEAVLARAKKKYGRGAVVLIDEYDKPMLDVLDTDVYVEVGPNKIRLEDYNRNTLKGFYSVFKAADEHLQFVMLTGVTKFSQVSVFSGFNQPADISLAEDYESLCGITEEELERYFPVEFKSLSNKYKCSESELRERFRSMYDGYHFSDNLLGIYNPFSVLNAFMFKRIDEYWFKSGSPTYLIRLMEHFDNNINELIRPYYPSSQFVDYRADVEEPLPMLYQSGYLTIKEFNPFTMSYKLDFPNDEVKGGFVSLLASDYLKPRESSKAWSVQVVESLRLGDVNQLQKLMTSFLAGIPYSQRRKSDERELERYFHYTFYLILRMISVYTVFTEKEQSEGRVDCVIETPDYIYIFEFKRDGTAQEAIEQINERGYAREYEADHRKLYKIGCNFSSETGTISDWLAEA